MKAATQFRGRPATAPMLPSATRSAVSLARKQGGRRGFHQHPAALSGRPQRLQITGIDMTPDGRTMFVNVQHPGELGGWSTFNQATNEFS